MGDSDKIRRFDDDIDEHEKAKSKQDNFNKIVAIEDDKVKKFTSHYNEPDYGEDRVNTSRNSDFSPDNNENVVDFNTDSRDPSDFSLEATRNAMMVQENIMHDDHGNLEEVREFEDEQTESRSSDIKDSENSLRGSNRE